MSTVTSTSSTVPVAATFDGRDGRPRRSRCPCRRGSAARRPAARPSARAPERHRHRHGDAPARGRERELQRQRARAHGGVGDRGRGARGPGRLTRRGRAGPSSASPSWIVVPAGPLSVPVTVDAAVPALTSRGSTSKPSPGSNAPSPSPRSRIVVPSERTIAAPACSVPLETTSAKSWSVVSPFPGHAVAADARAVDPHRERAASAPAGRITCSRLLRGSDELRIRDRRAVGDLVARVDRAVGGGHAQVEVVDERVADRRAGRVRPRERHAHRRRRVRDRVAAAVPVAGRGQHVNLVAVRTRRAVDDPVRGSRGPSPGSGRAAPPNVPPWPSSPPAMLVAGQRHQRLRHRRRRRGAARDLALVPVAHERGDAGRVRRRLRRADTSEYLVPTKFGVQTPLALKPGVLRLRAGRRACPARRCPASAGRRRSGRGWRSRSCRARCSRRSVTPQPSVPAARTLSAAPTVITFLAVPGAPIVFDGASGRRRAVVAGREDLDQLLVAGHAGRASRTIAVVELGVGVVGAVDRGAPGVVGDAGARGVRLVG